MLKLCKCGLKPTLFVREFLDPVYFNMNIEKVERRYFYVCKHCGRQAFQPGVTKAAATRQWNMVMNGERPETFLARSLNGWEEVAVGTVCNTTKKEKSN